MIEDINIGGWGRDLVELDYQSQGEYVPAVGDKVRLQYDTETIIIGRIRDVQCGGGLFTIQVVS